MRAALALLPVCLALDTLDPLVGLALGVVISAAFLRRALCPELFSRSQAKRVAKRVIASKIVQGRLLTAEEVKSWQRARAAAAPITPVKVTVAAKDKHASVPEILEEVETVLNKCLLDCFRSGGLYDSYERPSTYGAAECVAEAAMELMEETFGTRWMRCFLGSERAAKSGHEAEAGGRVASSSGDAQPASSPRAVGTAPTAVPELSAHEQAQLAQFQVVANKSGGGGQHGGGAIRALACTRVRAPAELVWERLHAFTEWHKMVDHCVGAEVYECDGADAAAAETVKAKVTLGVGFVRVTAHVHHTLDMAAGRSSWTLDEGQQNDVVANAGFWLVRPDPCGDPDACVIYYSAHVELAAWCPGWLNTLMAEQGCPKAVSWLRREAERKHRNRKMRMRAPPPSDCAARAVALAPKMGVPPSGEQPSGEQLEAFYGMWTCDRIEDAKYEEVASRGGVPWPIRKMLSTFTAQREVIKDAEGNLAFKSKMLTGSWTQPLYPGKEAVFELLGYKIVTVASWEDTPKGLALVTTARTTADAGRFSAAVDVTTRILHRIDADGHLAIETVAPEGTYTMWMVKKA